jgi:hypothetical protein
MNVISSKEKFEDMKGYSCKLKEDRQCHGLKQKDKSTMIYKAVNRTHKIPQHEILQKRWVNHVFQNGEKFLLL